MLVRFINDLKKLADRNVRSFFLAERILTLGSKTKFLLLFHCFLSLLQQTFYTCLIKSSTEKAFVQRKEI